MGQVPLGPLALVRKLKRWMLVGIGVTSLATTTTTARADQAWWTGLAGSQWNSGLTNWNTSATSGTPVAALPGGATDVYFASLMPGPVTLTSTLGQNFAINSLNFTAASGAVSVTSNTLTLNASGGIGINVEGGPGYRYLYPTIRLAGSQTWVNNGPTGVSTLAVGGIDGVSPGTQLTITGTGSTAITGSIGSNITGGIVKNGSGLLGLSGSNSTYTGGMTVNGGSLMASGDGDLGATGNGVTLGEGCSLSIAAPGASRVITINGSAANPSGFVGGMTMGASLLAGSGTLRLYGGITGSGTWNVDAVNTGFTGQIIVGGQGQLTPNGYLARTSPSAANPATLALRSAGTLPNVASVTVTRAAMLLITQPSTALTGRLGSIPLTFHSGQLTYNPSANGGAAINDTFGPVTIAGETTIIASSVAGSTAGTTINFGNITRVDHGTVHVRARQSGQGSIGGAPASTSVRMFFANLTADTVTSGTQRSVIPWASNGLSLTKNDADNLMTYDANGLRPLNQSTEFSSGLAAGANVRFTFGSETLPTNGMTINSLSIPSTGSYIGGNATDTVPGRVLTITSGAVANEGGSFRFIDATVNFPSGGYIYAGSDLGVTGYSRLTGTGGITVASNANLTLTNYPTGGNSFTGGLYINGEAGVSFTNNNQLGKDGSARASEVILLAGGNLFYNPGAAATVTLTDSGFHRPVSVRESGGLIGTSSSGATLQIPGLISGPGQLQFGGGRLYDNAGVVALTNSAANTYSGGTIVAEGILQIVDSKQLGTGNVLLGGGTLQAAGNLTFTGAPTVIKSSTIDTQGSDIALNAGINGSIGSSGNATDKVLTKKGTGRLTVAGEGDFAGLLVAIGGRLVMDGRLDGLANVSVSAPASVELSASHRIGDGASLTLDGGTLLTNGFNENLGVLYLAATAGSTIDLGNGSSRLTLADSHTKTWGAGTLNIVNWSGRAIGGGTDQIFVGASSSGLSTTQIARITFVNPAGFAPGNYPAQLLSTGELVPVGPDGVSPVDGTLALSPASPVDANTGLTIDFAGWLDASLPLAYAVLVDDIGVSTQGAAASRNIVSPLVPGIHTLKGRIYDSLGNVTETTQTFTVNTALESWRKIYFGTTQNTGTSADLADPDGDGLSNLFEYVAGLEPNSFSQFRVALEPVTGQPSQMRIKFSPLAAGRTYVVKYKDGLTDAEWKSLPDFSQSDNGPERTVIDQAASRSRFYKVEISIP